MSIEIEWKPRISGDIIGQVSSKSIFREVEKVMGGLFREKEEVRMDKELAEIGAKLREARLAANMTQEQAAESLKVSRETLSNWESGSACPNMTSITRMSKLYKVDLDDLMEETHYTDCLKASAGEIKSKTKVPKIIVLASYLFIWILTVAMYFVMDPGDAMGYSLVFFWGVIPVATFVVSFVIGLKSLWGKLGFIAPIILGVMYMLADLVTFRLSHMIDQNTFDGPKFIYLIAGIVISFIGLGIGLLIKRLKKTH